MRDANSRHVVHLITLQVTSDTEGEATKSTYIFTHPLFPCHSGLDA